MNDILSGQFVLVMAPSGSGKSTLIRDIKEVYPDMSFARTHTTRVPRPGEDPQTGTYDFVSNETFDANIAAGAYLEWATFGGHRYGTPAADVLNVLKSGGTVLKEMDLQGVKQVRALIPPEHLTVVYIDGGSWEALKERILARAPMSAEQLELRKERFLEEEKGKGEADVIVENHDGNVAKAKERFRACIATIRERL
ncbi:guanylate kinase [Candidatus Kaiserbacteria bacterium]|nr:guanylate kinase [Candidatus Kaiserbacteria bacterium]